MERLTSAEPLPAHLRGGVIALGNFDGFHRGHQAVVARARARAGASGSPLIIATFDPHPVRYFHPDAAPFRLTTLDQRERLFRRAGADAMLVFRFDADLAVMTPEMFVAERIVRATGASALVTGIDYTFGASRAGNVDLLREMARRAGIAVETVRPVSDAHGIISSSRIRDALRDGDCDTATMLLTRPFSVQNMVVHGNRIGRTIGFPTANLRLGDYLRPKYGVYAVRGRLPGGRVIDGVANLGVRPMIEPPEELLEPHFLDFTGDLYDQVIEVELIRWMRGEVKLSGLDELQQWIVRDCEEARAILAASPTSPNPRAMPEPEAPTRDWRDTVFLPKTDFPMKAGLAAKEPAILAKWRADDLYGALREARAGRERFLLHDGPPYANGDIHMGHAMNKVLKDLVVRTQSLLGKDAPYVPGWDCHGLPIEWKVEEAYRAKKLNKDEVPVDQFRAECRAYAAKWVAVQREQFERLGVMGEWDDPYLTMNHAAEAAIVGELLKFAETGQLYRGARPVMWSPVEKTALAEAEVEYEDITSTQIDVAFEIVEAPNCSAIQRLKASGATIRAIIWTTTPWTIPVNQALAYGPDVEYWVCDDVSWTAEKPVYNVIASDLLQPILERFSGQSWPPEQDSRLFWMMQAALDEPWRIKGSELEGAVARHPMHHLGGFFAKPRPMLPGDFVTTDAGTGLVHMAPDHGEDDFELCKAHGIDPVFAVEGDGKYRADWPWLGGQGSVINPKFNAPDGPICADLRAAGALLAASADYKHSYPHSWRSKAKLIFRATPQWFIGMDAPLKPSPLQGRGLGEGESATASGAPDGERLPLSPALSPEGERETNGPTLRELALDAIERTRFVPDKGRNRIGAMVAGRPDWVISRQRAWGVPIALYVRKGTGEYLRDPAVNARIVAAFEAGGADAWFGADHAALLGPDHDAADYEPQRDILDVWFDSGCTHVFTIEARYGADARADLYLEGSDQHRGWFQSSLLESCGTRGHAPYKGVLTHGFALDDKGRKMSKSVGNVVDPLKVIGESGADILRLWVASTDYFEDVRIGKEVLATTSDAYRKLRNTFRYLLGALEGFSEGERASIEDMPDLERYMLHLAVMLDAELRAATEAYEFNRYARALTDFCNNDLSAFFFDVRKDSLYCDAPADPKRRAYRTLLDVLFHALVRWAAPILCFTAEEVWGTRYPERGSVHLLEWPGIDPDWRDARLAGQWAELRAIRLVVNAEIEPKRRAKEIGSSLEARVVVGLPDARDRPTLSGAELAEVLIVSEATLDHSALHLAAVVHRTDYHKCGRCWRHLPEVASGGDLCARCAEVAGE